jgi:hypothetical protein
MSSVSVLLLAWFSFMEIVELLNGEQLRSPISSFCEAILGVFLCYESATFGRNVKCFAFLIEIAFCSLFDKVLSDVEAKLANVPFVKCVFPCVLPSCPA